MPRLVITPETLATLGAERLAALLSELADGNVALKRRLKVELEARDDPSSAGRAVRKRLATIGRSRSYVEWDRVGALAADLNAQREAIIMLVAPGDPKGAFELGWMLLGLADPLYDRCDDSNGEVGSVLSQTARDLAVLAPAARPDPTALAARIFDALTGNDYGQFDGLLVDLAPTLGDAGLAALEAQLTAWRDAPRPKPEDGERKVIGYGTRGPLYADEHEDFRRAHVARISLQEIAALRKDVDAYIAHYDAEARKVPKIAAEIGRLLIEADRADEALAAIDAVEEGRGGWIPFEWEDVRADALHKLGRTHESLSFRKACYERSLEPRHLRALLKALPDFDDVEAEEAALNHAQTFADLHCALGFFIGWPALDRASALVLARADELDGNAYGLLTPAAQALDAKHPLAATLCRRAMIDFILTSARTSRYKHAASHLAECGSSDRQIADYGNHLDHLAYVAALRAKHGRKSGFWSQTVE
jgi:hypothetical protein